MGTGTVTAFQLLMAVAGIVADLTTIGTSSVVFARSAAMAKSLAFEAAQRVWYVCSNRYPDIANFEEFGS